ncbi:MAG: hypothetical protein H0V82_01025 [Candidatus Protochlamydia sp.]|nr:hypothetical protein [Candidatus Protochlamydia sp.]
MNAIKSGNYIYNKNPGFFGNNDEHFQIEGAKAIKWGVITLSESSEKKADLKGIFFKILEKFAKERNAIAIKTGTQNATHYGLMRDSEEGASTGHSLTVLNERYSEYGEKMCTLLQKILIELPHDLNKFNQSNYSEESMCCGLKSSFELKVLDAKTLVEQKWIALEDLQQEERRIQARNLKIFNVTKSKQGTKEKLKFLKLKDPTLYTDDKMYFFINGMENAFPSNVNEEKTNFLAKMLNIIFPSDQNAQYNVKNKNKFINVIAKSFPLDQNEEQKLHFLKETMETIFPSIKNSLLSDGKTTIVADKMKALSMVIDNIFPPNQTVDNRKSHWVLATSRLQIDSSMYALSQFLTYMHFDGIHDPVERMKGRSPITIIHQDMFLIEGTLKNISRIFEKAVLWDSKTKDLSILLDEVGLLRYIFAHSMCLLNGSAAVGEWFEETLYNYHGYKVFQVEADKACDLEALTARSLGCFMDVYRCMTHLEKLQ